MSENDEEIKSHEEDMEKKSDIKLDTEKEKEKENQNENNINIINNEENQNNENNENNENNNINNESKQELASSKNNIEPENNYDYEKNKKEIMEKIEIRKFQADVVEKYINETGIGTAFQIIFSELLSKKVPTDNYYAYTASRLRQIGREKAALERNKEKNKNK